MDAIKETHYNLGIAYLETEEYSRAIPEFEAAIKLDSDFIEAHCALCRVYLEQDELEKASTLVTVALKLDATHQPALLLCDTITQAYYNKGKDHLDAERYTEAVSTFQSAITLDPDFTTAHYNLGLTYLKMEIYPRAVDALQKTIILDRNYKAAHHALALAYLGQQELGKARDAARDALKLDANYQPARSLLEAIDPSFTLPETQPATPSEPEQPIQQPAAKPRQETHYELGIAYRDSKMYTEAITEFQKVIDLDPNFLAAHISLGEVYLETGQINTAENAANTALRIDANSQSARQLLDDIRQARPPTPRQSRPTQLASTPPEDTSDVKQDLERGLVFLNSTQYNQAVAALKRVIKADPSLVEAHYGLGQAYLELGAFDDAKAAAEEVLKRKPNHREAREFLQIIRFARNMERNRKIRKKVLSYAAIFGIIAVCVFAGIKFDVIPSPVPSPTPPDLSIAVSLEEPSGNGFLDAGEEARIRIKISNSGGTVRGIRLKFDPPFISGIRYRQPAPISKLGKNSTETVAVSLIVSDNARSRTHTLKINVFGADGLPLASKDFSLKIQRAKKR